ncbi:hypothetical protein DUNSADRAFT_5835 [Dunaliella salina]|uniref:Uncharacterized protein n=1 Tax=Dunaliella salina TaxID=3046 RepID=A0ABQ7FU33_DUNSA|nr:hypothetical protein DUNSADRAFT_5835 [Dunaliella salina]|eukprot:KAF5825933.1 hypothetical protein DUNSADRAFT_5835 [Dunaliella salina]
MPCICKLWPQTEATRRRWRFLSHLPLASTFQVRNSWSECSPGRHFANQSEHFTLKYAMVLDWLASQGIQNGSHVNAVQGGCLRFGLQRRFCACRAPCLRLVH